LCLLIIILITRARSLLAVFNEREKRMKEKEFFLRELRAIRDALYSIGHPVNRPLSQAAIDLIKMIDERERAAYTNKMKVKDNE